MKSAMLVLAAVMMVVSDPVAAQSKSTTQAKSVAGIWNATVTTPNGGGNPTLTFAVKGDSVTGTVKRNDLTYSYTIAPNGQQVLVTVKAKVVGDSLGGTMDFAGAMTGQITAKRAPQPPKK